MQKIDMKRRCWHARESLETFFRVEMLNTKLIISRRILAIDLWLH